MLIVNYEILCIGLSICTKKKNPKPKTLKVQITCKVLVVAPDVPEFNAARTKIAMKVVSEVNDHNSGI